MTNLVKTGDILLKSEPFRPFDGDCKSCKHYDDISPFVEGGKCLKHSIGCGWGFTCADHQKKNNY